MNFFSDAISQSFESLENLPSEIGTEAVSQFKNSSKQQQNQNSQTTNNQSGISDQQHQKYLDDLYGTSNMTQQQIQQKKAQDGQIRINNYKKIQQEIQEYRAKKSQQKTKYEIGWQQGTEAARTQEEEMELWEKQQKKAEEKRKKEESDRMNPGSAAARSGEQGAKIG